MDEIVHYPWAEQSHERLSRRGARGTHWKRSSCKSVGGAAVHVRSPITINNAPLFLGSFLSLRNVYKGSLRITINFTFLVNNIIYLVRRISCGVIQ